MDNNKIDSNIKEIETTNTNMDDKVLNSETERLKIEKEKDASPKEIIIQVEQEIKEEIREEIKIDNNSIEERDEEEEDENTELNDENIKIEKKSINIQKIKAQDILKETQLELNENLDLLKIELSFIAHKEYKWDVYRTPKETKEFFKKLYKSLHKDEKGINLGIVEILNNLKDCKDFGVNTSNKNRIRKNDKK